MLVIFEKLRNLDKKLADSKKNDDVIDYRIILKLNMII